MLARDVHPQTALSAYRARAVDLESHTVCWDGGWAEVYVWWIAGQIWRAIVFEGQEVDSAVVDLLWGHFASDATVEQRDDFKDDSKLRSIRLR